MSSCDLSVDATGSNRNRQKSQDRRFHYLTRFRLHVGLFGPPTQSLCRLWAPRAQMTLLVGKVLAVLCSDSVHMIGRLGGILAPWPSII